MHPYCEDPGRLVLKRASMAMEAGLAGVVCSGLEVRRIKEALGKRFLAVTPGIRPAGKPVPRTTRCASSPRDAQSGKGADYLVVGRPIRDAIDPQDAAARIAGRSDRPCKIPQPASGGFSPG